MQPDPEMVAILTAGLEVLDYVETACAYGEGFRRFGKFGRLPGSTGEAYYVQSDGTLWFSQLHFTEPEFKVIGPVLDNIFDAGCGAADLGSGSKRANRAVRIDADAALDELMEGK